VTNLDKQIEHKVMVRDDHEIHEHIVHEHTSDQSSNSNTLQYTLRILDVLVFSLFVGYLMQVPLFGRLEWEKFLFVSVLIYSICSASLHIWRLAEQLERSISLDFVSNTLFATPIGYSALIKISICITILLIKIIPSKANLKQIEIGLAIILLLSFPLNGHAIAAQSMTWAKTSLHFIHMSTVVWWFSGIAGLFIYTWKRTLNQEKLRQLQRKITIFSRIALPLLSISVIAGGFSAIDKFNSFQELWQSNYGVILLIKIMLTALIVVIGGFHRIWWIPRMQKATDDKAIRPLIFAVRIELIVAILLLVIAGMLAVTPYPG
jgi:putative copper export protein